MKRLVIIDHTMHVCHIEDVYDEDLESYNGCIEDYIMDSYNLTIDDFSWDYVTDIDYFMADEKTPYDVDLNAWFDD